MPLELNAILARRAASPHPPLNQGVSSGVGTARARNSDPTPRSRSPVTPHPRPPQTTMMRSVSAPVGAARRGRCLHAVSARRQQPPRRGRRQPEQQQPADGHAEQRQGRLRLRRRRGQQGGAAQVHDGVAALARVDVAALVRLRELRVPDRLADDVQRPAGRGPGFVAERLKRAAATGVGEGSLRDGTDGNTPDPDNANAARGLHEPTSFYQACEARERNKGCTSPTRT